MSANEPTRVECSLVHAQNALMQQSQLDAEGRMNGHGWGVADYRDGVPLIEKQTWAAFHGEHFRKSAARVYAHTVVAHVRRATVGSTSIENTHPFNHDTSKAYRAVEIAPEPISDDNWEPNPDGIVFSVDEDYYLLVESLDKYSGTVLV